jgi:Restriction endonuclease
MPRKGRALEQLVAELERVLGPTDVVIQSPEFIVGRNTGELREVDVTLRTKAGSSDLLVMIECRDRKRKQGTARIEGTEWIEQVASKQEDVGANKAVAVCPGGFTKGARRLAEAKQIDLRTVVSVTAPEVFGWLRLETVSYRHWNMEYRAIRFGVQEGHRLELEPELSEGLSSPNPGLVPVLVRRADGKPVSVHDVWNTVRKDEVFAGLEPDKQHEVTVTFSIDGDGDPPPYQIRTVDGLADIVGLELGGLLDYTEHELPISRFREYVDESGALVQTAEVDVHHEGARLVFGLNATPDRRRHSVTVRRVNADGPEMIHVQMSGVYEGVIDEMSGRDTS